MALLWSSQAGFFLGGGDRYLQKLQPRWTLLHCSSCVRGHFQICFQLENSSRCSESGDADGSADKMQTLRGEFPPGWESNQQASPCEATAQTTAKLSGAAWELRHIPEPVSLTSSCPHHLQKPAASGTLALAANRLCLLWVMSSR